MGKVMEIRAALVTKRALITFLRLLLHMHMDRAYLVKIGLIISAHKNRYIQNFSRIFRLFCSNVGPRQNSCVAKFDF